MGGRGTDLPGSSWGRYFEAFSLGGGGAGGGGGLSAEERREFEGWVGSLESAEVTVPGREPYRVRMEYQVRHCGPTEYRVQGGGEPAVWADGVRREDGYLLDAKHVGDPGRSPFVSGSAAFEPVRRKLAAEVGDEVRRYAAVVNDPANPARGLEIVTNDGRAVPFFEGLLREHGCPGRVVVRR